MPSLYTPQPISSTYAGRKRNRNDDLLTTRPSKVTNTGENTAGTASLYARIVVSSQASPPRGPTDPTARLNRFSQTLPTPPASELDSMISATDLVRHGIRFRSTTAYLFGSASSMIAIAKVQPSAKILVLVSTPSFACWQHELKDRAGDIVFAAIDYDHAHHLHPLGCLASLAGLGARIRANAGGVICLATYRVLSLLSMTDSKFLDIVWTFVYLQDAGARDCPDEADGLALRKVLVADQLHRFIVRKDEDDAKADAGGGVGAAVGGRSPSCTTSTAMDLSDGG